MLSSLRIENIVLIKQLTLELDRGLNVLTGETGAGKSILLGSLNLALGARADAGLLRAGSEKGSVTAVFEGAQRADLQALLEEADIELEDQLILRRRIKADGASRAYINDAPVSAGLLRAVGAILVEIHGQHDERGLLDVKGHLSLLDQFGGHAKTLAAVDSAFQTYQSAAKTLAKRQAQIAEMAAEEDYLRTCTEELQRLAPKVGEEESLALRRAEMQRGSRMLSSLQDAYAQATEEGGPDAQLRSLIRTLARLPEAEDERLAPVLDMLDRAAIETDAALSQLSDLIRSVDIDPAELDSVEQRLFDLRGLARKHDMAVDRLPDLAETFRQKLTLLDAAETDVGALEQALAAARGAFEDVARALSAKRRAAAAKLDKAVNGELPPLRMDAAKFQTVLEPVKNDHWSSSGAETARFEISTNPGAPFGPLIKIASGGELSRFILALKVALAGQGGASTMVFDEVDRGVGGPTAAAVGKRLARLADDGQVIVVTHSPQVAALAQRHWQIAKSGRQDVTTNVVLLGDADRREEIARMLSGETITEAARAAAESLLTPVP